jgi:WD40 repeat protein
VRLWDAGRGRQRAILLGHGAEVNALAFSPDGKRLASGSSDATVRIWDVDEARELLTLAGFHASVFTLAFSPDGARLAVGDLEGGYQILEAVPLAQRPAASAVE